MIYCQFQMLIIDYSLDMFQASLCPSSGEKTTCYCIWSIFAGSVGCGRLRYCGATLRVWCLKHVETVVNNQHLKLTINHLYCCILLVFFLHALLTMHGHRNIKITVTLPVPWHCSTCSINFAISSDCHQRLLPSKQLDRSQGWQCFTWSGELHFGTFNTS